VWLSDQPSPDFRRWFHALAESIAVRPFRLQLEKNAATFTFVSSGDLKAELQMIDLILKEANGSSLGSSTGFSTGSSLLISQWSNPRSSSW